MHLAIAHHFGWAVAVTADDEHRVVDRRRIELLEPGRPAAPVHHDGVDLDDDGLAALIHEVRASSAHAVATELDELTAALPAPITTLSLRAWPADFPDDIAALRRVPFEARADSVMYRQVLAAEADVRGWTQCRFDAGKVEAQATELLGPRAHEVLHGPRATLGPPWSKDHRIALAATVLASRRTPAGSDRPVSR